MRPVPFRSGFSDPYLLPQIATLRVLHWHTARNFFPKSKPRHSLFSSPRPTPAPNRLYHRRPQGILHRPLTTLHPCLIPSSTFFFTSFTHSYASSTLYSLPPRWLLKTIMLVTTTTTPPMSWRPSILWNPGTSTRNSSALYDVYAVGGLPVVVK